MASPVLTGRAHFSSLLFPSGGGSGRGFPTRATPPSQVKMKDRRLLSFRIRAEAEAEAESMVTEKLGIKVERKPPESKLSDLGVRQWPKWWCPPATFPWTYSQKETCYLVEGKVKVFPKGHGDEFVQIEAGDLVEFPEGMNCTWEVLVGVDKHYKLE